MITDKKLLKMFRCGIEREALRIDQRGLLSKKAHPKELGSPLTHPRIGTDFSEQQLEWNTAPHKGFAAAEKSLQELIHFTLEKMESELLWPFSMPCALEKIEIARYGSSHLGQKKELYREGLRKRYGEKLQMVSGIHFNFSWDLPFWKALHKKEGTSEQLQPFINDRYLGLLRNFLREGWLLTYLFGASPAIDPSYTSNQEGFLRVQDALIHPNATSIRMSPFGYYSRIQEQIAISFNSLEGYLSDMRRALTTKSEKYQSITKQLNAHLLQIENEHYSRIRPKAVALVGETPLQALENRGIEYLEVRAIDIDPFHPTGMGREQIDFLHLFLLYCLFKKSPPLSKKCQRCLTLNQNDVALYGRQKELSLSGKAMTPWSEKILREMEPYAKLLGNTPLLQKQLDKVRDPQKTPSAHIQRAIEGKGWKKFGVMLAKKHKKALIDSPLGPKKKLTLEKMTESSLVEKRRLESQAEILVDGYEDLELSTQILIKEALKRGVQVEVLDRTEQFLRLSKNGIVEYVKEATKTSKDTYITPHLLENKEMTKRILYEKGIHVPNGKSYESMEEAFGDYPLFAKRQCVVKPKSTNFGVGISFISSRDEKKYREGIKHAFSFGKAILVEELCPGEEFRFLIINGKVLGVAKRVPAHVVGDGVSKIKELVAHKNNDPNYYRHPKTHIHLGLVEKKHLKALRLSPESIPRKGKRIFLRSNSNVSTGGDAVDVTDEVHRGYFTIAAEATKLMEARICGVDMMIPAPQKAPTSKNYAIIEMNYNPVLFIHAYPFVGKRRSVAAPLLDLLGFSDQS